MRNNSVPGVDGAGVVVAVGSDKFQHLLGKRVAYHQSLLRQGAFVQGRIVMQIPVTLTDEQATALPYPALTAWQALEKIPVKPGKQIFISGAGSSVGQYLVQLAIQRGFIVSTLSNQRHWNKLKAFGVKACFDDQTFPESEILSASFFAIIDTRTDQSTISLTALLGPSGHLVTINDNLRKSSDEPFSHSWSKHRITLESLHRYGKDEDWLELTLAGEMMMRGVLYKSLNIDQIIAADFTALAQQLTELKYRKCSNKMVCTYNRIQNA